MNYSERILTEICDEVEKMRIRQAAHERNVLNELKNISAQLTAISRKIKAPEDDVVPILQGIIGTWKLVSSTNCEVYVRQCMPSFANRWYYADFTFSIENEDVATLNYVSDEPGSGPWIYQIGVWKQNTKILVDEEKNSLKLMFKDGNGNIRRTVDHFIEHGKLHRVCNEMGRTCERVYMMIKVDKNAISHH
uniref:Uncharacterized protein n=1 Tax=Caenorhabditis japonica TaxID=281687 RepID=A0A8R1HTZ0_CAEJA